MGQRSDDHRFRKVLGAVEERLGTIPDWIEITIDVGAIPTGYDWDKLSVEIGECLLSHREELPYDRGELVEIPGVPFMVGIRREHASGEGRIVVMRRVPVDIEERRCEVMSRALESKRGVLEHYKYEGYATVLLMEDYDIALTNRYLICDTFQKVSPLELCADAIDEVYLIETATSPWAISPLKIGSQIFEEPSPEWPDAPGYPHIDT